MGALIALMMAGSSSPMMAAETYDATTRELIRNADKIQARYGVNVMSTTEEGQLRSDIVEAILEIGKKASAPGGGGEAGLLEVLPAEGIRGVAMALDPAWRDAIRKILAVQASTADMFRDAQFMAQSPETQQQSMQQQIEGRMDELMLGPLSKVMSAAQTAVPAAIAAGEIGFGAYIVGKGLGGLYRGVRSVLGRFGVGRGVAGAAGGLGGAMGSVATMRVGVMYVGSVMPGGPGGRGRGGPGALVPVGRGATPGARQVLSLPPGTGVRGVLGRFGARLRASLTPLGRAGSAIGRAGSAIGQYGRSLPSEERRK